MTVEYIWIQGENGATMMAKQPQADTKGLFGPEGMTFKDALDIINPLQQIPIIGSIYRELTGDTIKPGARIIGGAIYGLGVGGIIAAAANNAVEETTGHDAGGTAVAMVKGQSLGDMMQTAQAGRDKSARQLASAQYFSGGADPIDPTSLPAGAKMIDVPVATPNSQLASLPADPVAPVADAAPASPVAAPQTAVSVSPLLPPTIGRTGGLPTNAHAQQGVGAPTGDAGLIPAVPTLPPGATGLSAGSHLPTAGSITPAGASLTTAGIQNNLSPTTAPAHGPLAMAAPNPSPAATSQAASAGMPLAAPATSGFPIPPRTNNVIPRMPIATSQMNVGTQPLALSNTDRRNIEPIKLSAPATPPTSAPAVTSAATPAAAAAGPLPSPNLPVAQVPDAMMRALDKYDALMRSRRKDNGQVDQSL